MYIHHTNTLTLACSHTRMHVYTRYRPTPTNAQIDTHVAWSTQVRHN